jgi:hypothetical protein
MFPFAATGTMGSNATLSLQELHLQTPLGWFVKELGWHKHNTLTPTTTPVHPNPKKYICKKTMSSVLLGIISFDFSSSRTPQRHIRGAKAVFSSTIIQFLHNQHWNCNIPNPTTNQKPLTIKQIFSSDGSGNQDEMHRQL